MTRTAAATALALPDVHQPATGRRRFLAALASLPIVGAVGASFFTSRADAAAATIVTMIEAAEARCLATSRAFKDALATYEATLPRMHPDLDYTKRQAFRFGGFDVPLECGFEGAHVTRGDLNSHGYRYPRYIVTSRICEELLEHQGGPIDRRYLGRLHRRAKRYEAAVAQREEQLELERLRDAKDAAREDFEKLGEAIFAQPGRSRAALYAQARMIRSLCVVADYYRNRAWRCEQWGTVLAEAVCDLGGRAA